MPAGEYIISFDYITYIGLGNTLSVLPEDVTGLTRLFNVTDAPIAGTSDTTSVLDYDSDPTSERAAITGQAYTFDLTLNLSPGDPGYQILQTANKRAIPDSAAVIFWRESPLIAGSTDDPEVYTGLATVPSFTPSITVAGVSTITMNLTGFGNNRWHPQGRPVATLTVASPGSGMTEASYPGIALRATGIGGLGVTANVDVDAGGTVATPPTIVTAGRNWRVGDVLTADIADLGGAGVPPTFEVATVG